MSTDLSTAPREKLEQIVRTGLGGFGRAHAAFLAIRERELWRETEHASFDAYSAAVFHLNRKQRQLLIGEALTAQPEASDRAIGRLAGVDHKTVGKARRDREGGESPHPTPASHPPSDGDRSTHPAPEVPPAPSSPSPDEEVMPDLRGDPRPADDTPPAAEPSEPGVAGAPNPYPGYAEDAAAAWEKFRREHPVIVCTDPAHADLIADVEALRAIADQRMPIISGPPTDEDDERDRCSECGCIVCIHLTEERHAFEDIWARMVAEENDRSADLLSLLRDLDRLLLPRDEQDWLAWGLGDDEAAGRALMVKVRGLLGEAPPVQTEPEAEGAASIIQRWDDAARAENDTAEAADERTVAIRRHLARMAAKDRARFLRAHRITDLELWLDGLDGDELDSALRLLGLVGAETA